MKTVVLVLSIVVGYSIAYGQSFAVVELFTSQGCSSCPAADKNLTEILQQAEKEGKHVYGLSFHVDYWNYIGWKDPYSSKEFTERQKNYSNELGLDGIYTPQMVVNGHAEFVGSNKSKAEESIKKALSQKASYSITISNVTVSGDKVHFFYTLDKDPANEVVNFAVVEKSVENYVPKGENSGKKLHHDNVVKGFKSIEVKKNGEVQVTVKSLNAENSLVIAYVQDEKLNIVAATAVEIR